MRDAGFRVDLSSSCEARDQLVSASVGDCIRLAQHQQRLLQGRDPLSVRICALLSKPSRRKVDVQVDFLGFEVPDVFVVGYGLDAAQRHRHLPYIATLGE